MGNEQNRPTTFRSCQGAIENVYHWLARPRYKVKLVDYVTAQSLSTYSTPARGHRFGRAA
jgi:hypothetical protein